LRSCNSANWWRETKRLTGQSKKQSDLDNLVNNAAGGDVQEVAEITSTSMVNVSADLTPLGDCSIPHQQIPCQFTKLPEEVEYRMTRI